MECNAKQMLSVLAPRLALPIGQWNNFDKVLTSSNLFLLTIIQGEQHLLDEVVVIGI
jgi:hypothetical protein